MIIKGNSRGSPVALAGHLLSVEHNETAELVELDGVAADNLRGALIEMDARAAGSRCTRTLYHASINMAPDEALTPDQWREAVCRLEAELGFEGQPKAVVRHVKDGREHVHIVWSRYDLDHDRAISDSHNYAAHERVSRALEREFGHERVQGVHVDADRSQARPVAELSHAEWQQAERTRIDPRKVKSAVTAAWREAADGPAFAAALERRGYVLARGDRRDCVIIDRAGGLHSLRRRIEGAKAADIKGKLAGMNRLTLPNVEQARALQAERAQKAEQARAEQAAIDARADAERCALERAQLERRLAREAQERETRLLAELLEKERWERGELARHLTERRAEAEAQREKPGLLERTRRTLSPERARAAEEAEAARIREREQAERGRWELLAQELARHRAAELARHEERRQMYEPEARTLLEERQAARRAEEETERQRRDALMRDEVALVPRVRQARSVRPAPRRVVPAPPLDPMMALARGWQRRQESARQEKAEKKAEAKSRQRREQAARPRRFRWERDPEQQQKERGDGRGGRGERGGRER